MIFFMVSSLISVKRRIFNLVQAIWRDQVSLVETPLNLQNSNS